MKKTLIMILAIVLVISVCFAAVGCKDNTDKGGDTTCTSHVDSNDDGKCDVCGVKLTTTTKDPSAADLAAAEIISSYTDAWLINNAGSVNAQKLSTLMSTLAGKYPTVISSIKVDAAGANAYKITYAFKDKAKLETTVNAVAANEGNHAGSTFLGTAGGVDSDHALGAIINAAFKTCKTAVENGQVFAENGFGFDATAYFEFNYGDMGEKLAYGLRVAGQIGIEAKDTFAGIEVLNGNDVIGGLYYQGADNKADCKLYLNAGEYKYYIDNADINAIVVSVIDLIQQIVGGNENVPEEIAAALETPFYNSTVETLSELLPESVSGMVGPILTTVIDEVNTTVLGNGDTQYQICINIGDLLSYVQDLISSMGIDLSSIISKLPAPLNQLDLATFQGVGGVLMLTAVVNDNGLGGLELSYNAPKQDFRFSYEDTQAKVYGPINVAIGIKDFELAEQNVADVIPSEVSGYDYFSPLNAELKVDVVVNDVSYTANIVSDINPFAVENGVITFVVSKDDAAWMNGRIEIVSPEEDDNGWNGLVVVDVDGLVYKFYTGDFASSLGQIAGETFNQVLATENVFTPVINYILDLIAQFAPADDDVELNPAEAEGGLNLDAITGAFGIVDAAKELIANWQESGVLVYKVDGETLLDNYFQVKLTSKEYNEVLALINQYIAPIIGNEFPDFTADAANVVVSANYGEHEKQIYVSVEYKDISVLVVLDGTKWESNKTIDLTVNVNDDLYILALDASVENVYNVTYTAKDVKYVDVTLDLDKLTISATLVANGNTHQFDGALEILENNIGGIVTLNLNGVEVALTGKLAYGTVTGATSFGVPTVKFGAQFGWKLPNNETNVKVDVELISWGSEVTVADNANLLALDATADINEALQEAADAFLQAIALTVNE